MNFPDHKTRIVATIGPASQDPATLAAMIRAGLNVARLNFSHGSEAYHAELIQTIRAVAAETGHRVAIMGDLPGPKMRIGDLSQEPVELLRDDTIILTTRELAGSAGLVSVSFPGLPAAVRPGDRLFINDGFILLKVQEVQGDDVICSVRVGGELRSRKGLNLPGIDLGISAFTDQDHEWLRFAARHGVDAVSQSFVASASDIDAVRAAAQALDYDPFIIAKIERRDALDQLDAILAASDGIMVARGDLGVEIPIEEIAVTQKRIVAQANRAGKPVITATQMLESMVKVRRPTRAEATDVANAILDGTDCVMLSAESAMGVYPVESVAMLAGIAAAVEPSRPQRSTSQVIGETGGQCPAGRGPDRREHRPHGPAHPTLGRHGAHSQRRHGAQCRALPPAGLGHRHEPQRGHLPGPAILLRCLCHQDRRRQGRLGRMRAPLARRAGHHRGSGPPRPGPFRPEPLRQSPHGDRRAGPTAPRLQSGAVGLTAAGAHHSPLPGTRFQSIQRPAGRRLAWSDLGDPRGEPVVYCRGFPSSRHEALRLDPVAGAQGLRVLAAVGARVTGTPTTSLGALSRTGPKRSKPAPTTLGRIGPIRSPPRNALPPFRFVRARRGLQHLAEYRIEAPRRGHRHHPGLAHGEELLFVLVLHDALQASPSSTIRAHFSHNPLFLVICAIPQLPLMAARRSQSSGQGRVRAAAHRRRPTREGRSKRRLIRYCASAR